MSLLTPNLKVRMLQRALYAKAKAEPGYRFYSLWDKIYRKDILLESYQRCRRNSGSSGVDRDTFDSIESRGLNRWLAQLEEELREGRYRSLPLRSEKLVGSKT